MLNSGAISRRFIESENLMPILFPDDEIQEVTKQVAVSDGGCEACVGGHYRGTVADHAPEFVLHQLETLP